VKVSNVTDFMIYSPGENDITVFAETTFRNQRKRFGIKRRDRRAHMYLIGKTGMGKSTLMETMILSDLQKGEGLAVLDPHGDLVDRVKAQIPLARQRDVIYFAPGGENQRVALNPLDAGGTASRHLVASELISIFKKLWADSWGPRTEHILRNTLLALLELPAATLPDALRLLSDYEYRQALVAILEDGPVKKFWIREFEQYSKNFRTEAISPIQNKVGQFVTHPVIGRIIAQRQSSFDMRRLMDEGNVLLVDLSKGKVGEDASRLLGAMILAQIELAALGRADIAEAKRRDFYVYIDEFYNFTSSSFAGILAEARKYRLNLIMAHQYMEQLDEALRAAIFGNVGTIVSFRLGERDAPMLTREFSPIFSGHDLINLPPYHICLKLMIDGFSQSPFSARALPPFN
jgi:Type IV secretion-system coupling protein DNA-binding domain